LLERTLHGIGVAAVAEFARDLSEITDADEARNRAAQFCEAALNDPSIEVVGKLTWVADVGVRLNFPVEADLPSFPLPLNDADLLHRILRELMNRHFGRKHLDSDGFDPGTVFYAGVWFQCQVHTRVSISLY